MQQFVDLWAKTIGPISAPAVVEVKNVTPNAKHDGPRHAPDCPGIGQLVNQS
ncbi:MAG: hypothetical protein OXH83_09390 [Bryobacterales bacterium]|nr:hypothetical protein [Bryobacterales bacterium]